MFSSTTANIATVAMFLAGEIDAETMNVTVALQSQLFNNVQPYCCSYDPQL